MNLRPPAAFSRVCQFALAFGCASIVWAQAPDITGVVNAFSGVPVAPWGSLAAVNGGNFGADAAALTATVQGQAAPVLSAIDTRMIIQMPWLLQSSPAALVVSRAGVSSLPFDVHWRAYSVGLETTDGRYVLLLDATSLAPVNQVQRGQTVIAFATGMGPTNPPVPLGTLPSGTATCASPPTVTIGPFNAPVSGCGLDPNRVGVYRLQFTIPAIALSGTQSLVIAFSFTRPGFAENQPVLVTVAPLAPAISAVVENAASNLPPGLPNSGVAQGALFVVKGADLGPATLAQASDFPLPFVLGGTSIGVTVGSTTLSAILVSAQASRVTAILPSNTPVGDGTVTVRYNGQSTSAPVTVVQNAIGIFTVNESGSGDAIAFAGDGGPITPTHAANPGEVVVFRGTGLGPVDADESQPAPGADMPEVPLHVFVGGVEAEVGFRGRNSCCSGMDAVYVTVPDGVEGCAVSVIVQIGGAASTTISNAATIAVAPEGRACTPISPDPTRSGTGTHTFAVFALNRLVNNFPVNAPKADSASSSFRRITFSDAPLGFQMDINSYGSCTTAFTQARMPTPAPPDEVVYLDAGATLRVAGPFGDAALSRTTSGAQISYLVILDNTAESLTPGEYTFSGDGGADVGPFAISYSMPAPFAWTNAFYNHDPVDRAAGLTVTWDGSDPDGYVAIGGTSHLVGPTAATSGTVSFTCTAKGADRIFTVPPYVLLSLPAGSGALTVAAVAKPQTVAPPPGIEVASAVATFFYASAVVFQ